MFKVLFVVRHIGIGPGGNAIHSVVAEFNTRAEAETACRAARSENNLDIKAIPLYA